MNTSESENDKLHKHDEGKEGIEEFSLFSVRGCTRVVKNLEIQWRG